MALVSDNVDVAVTGAVYYARPGIRPPRNATTPLTRSWRDVGYIHEDGVTENRERSTSEMIAWQNADRVRTAITEGKFSISFKMIETNPNSIELFYGARVDPDDGSVEIVASATGGRRQMVLDYIDPEAGDDDRYVRLWLPRAEISEIGEVEYKNEDAVGYELTVEGLPHVLDRGGDDERTITAKKWFSRLINHDEDENGGDDDGDGDSDDDDN